ncbi:MAG: TVP38/TMEM64 family protein [Kiloniellales bacterium]
MSGTDNKPTAARFSLWRLAPLLVLILGLIAFFAFGFHHQISAEAFQRHSASLTEIADHWWAPLAYFAIYVLVTAFSLPVAVMATIAGGYMFGALLATLLTATAATLGATAVFLIARSALGEPLRVKAGPAIKKMESGFRKNALNYLLVLRLIPLFPFWLVNLVPAFLGVPLSTYVIGTVLGIVPGSFVFSNFGAGLQSVLSQGSELTLDSVVTPQIVISLVGLAILALLPVAYRKWKARARRSGPE